MPEPDAIKDLLKSFVDHMLSSDVLSFTGKLDTALKMALLEKMRPISKRLKARLFDGYGPLSTFSAKIDMAFAFSILDEDLYADLQVIRQVRNMFAHPAVPLRQPVTFENDDVIKICKKFKDYDPSIACVDLFGVKAAKCLLRLTQDKQEIETIKKLLSDVAAASRRP
jgi:DNA-binding MltR family transcriptional regulator